MIREIVWFRQRYGACGPEHLREQVQEVVSRLPNLELRQQCQKQLDSLTDFHLLEMWVNPNLLGECNGKVG